MECGISARLLLRLLEDARFNNPHTRSRTILDLVTALKALPAPVGQPNGRDSFEAYLKALEVRHAGRWLDVLLRPTLATTVPTSVSALSPSPPVILCWPIHRVGHP